MTLTNTARWFLLATAALAMVACSSVQKTSTEALRSADEILAELDQTTYPNFDRQRRNDEEYVAQIRAERAVVSERRSDLIRELYLTDPEHPRTAELLLERWAPNGGSRSIPAKDAQQEVESVIARYGPDTSIGREARYARAMLAVRSMWTETDPEVAQTALQAVNALIADVPDDHRAAILLYQVAAFNVEWSTQQQTELLQRVVDLYGENDHPEAVGAVQLAAGTLKQLSAIGERFDFAFTCAVTGEHYDTDSLAGNVVVVDFWATWCGPCIAMMPDMKDLYAQYHDQGVQFIGISLDAPQDQGGLESLLAFVKDNEIPWPQWYQGNGWNSEFSRSWGINAIPSLFIVDAQGRLRSTNARNNLQEQITQLIAERDAQSAAR